MKTQEEKTALAFEPKELILLANACETTMQVSGRIHLIKRVSKLHDKIIQHSSYTQAMKEESARWGD